MKEELKPPPPLRHTHTHTTTNYRRKNTHSKRKQKPKTRPSLVGITRCWALCVLTRPQRPVDLPRDWRHKINACSACKSLLSLGERQHLWIMMGEEQHVSFIQEFISIASISPFQTENTFTHMYTFIHVVLSCERNASPNKTHITNTLTHCVSTWVLVCLG